MFAKRGKSFSHILSYRYSKGFPFFLVDRIEPVSIFLNTVESNNSNYPLTGTNCNFPLFSHFYSVDSNSDNWNSPLTRTKFPFLDQNVTENYPDNE